MGPPRTSPDSVLFSSYNVLNLFLDDSAAGRERYRLVVDSIQALGTDVLAVQEICAPDLQTAQARLRHRAAVRGAAPGRRARPARAGRGAARVALRPDVARRHRAGPRLVSLPRGGVLRAFAQCEWEYDRSGRRRPRADRRPGDVLWVGGLHDAAAALRAPWRATAGHYPGDPYGARGIWRRIDGIRVTSTVLGALRGHHVEDTGLARHVSDHLPVTVEYAPPALGQPRRPAAPGQPGAHVRTCV